MLNSTTNALFLHRDALSDRTTPHSQGSKYRQEIPTDINKEGQKTGKKRRVETRSVPLIVLEETFL